LASNAPSLAAWLDRSSNEIAEQQSHLVAVSCRMIKLLRIAQLNPGEFDGAEIGPLKWLPNYY
jgi:hypothetical protein